MPKYLGGHFLLPKISLNTSFQIGNILESAPYKWCAIIIVIITFIFVVDFVWQWQDEKNRWNPYSVEHSVLLEAAKQNSEDSVDIVAAHRAYKIDLQSMEQSNVTTQVIRKVERHKIGRFENTLLWLFFSNLHSQQIFVCETWCLYKSFWSRVDTVTAALSYICL